MKAQQLARSAGACQLFIRLSAGLYRERRCARFGLRDTHSKEREIEVFTILPNEIRDYEFCSYGSAAAGERGNLVE